MNHLLNQKEAAQLLSITPATLKRWRKQGTGPAFIQQAPSRIRYDEEILKAWAYGK